MLQETMDFFPYGISFLKRLLIKIAFLLSDWSYESLTVRILFMNQTESHLKLTRH